MWVGGVGVGCNFGLEVNAEKTIYMFMYYQCYVGINYGMKDSR